MFTKFKKVFPFALFSILGFLIVLFWFKDGLYYGGAEVGISPFYNPERNLNIQRFIWWADVAPGVLIPQFVNAVPFYFILSLLQKISSPIFIQAFLFFWLICLMGFGMYLLTLSYIGKEKKFYALLAGIFYMFNSYMMVEVWHRFLYTGIFLAASFPILALFWKKWIQKGTFLFLTFFLLTNLFFSYMYGNLTSFIAVWILCFLIALAEMIFPWQGKKMFLVISYKFILGLFLFLLTNLWWLLPVLQVSTEVLPQQHNIEDNLGTLISISNQTIIPFTLQYANPFYLFHTQEFGKIYTTFIFLLLPWIPIVVIFIGVFFSLKNKSLAAVVFSYLVALIIAKGAASPFGYPYIWAFMENFFIGIIRNPFEKLGVLMPLFGSILFVVGLENLFLFSKGKLGNSISRLLVVSILLSVFIYSFPMITGRVFNKPGQSLKVKVPSSYQQADEWLKLQKTKDGNILHLPFSGGDVATYNWDNGYHGVEINEILFTALPSITRNSGIKRFDETLKSLTYSFVSPYSENKEQMLRVFQNFNVRYIVLHKDINWNDKDTYGENGELLNPAKIESVLNNLDFLEKKQQFGQLVIYKILDKDYRAIFSISNNNQVVYPGQTDIMKIISLSNKDIITPLANTENDLLKSKTQISFPYKKIQYVESSPSAMIASINDIFANQSQSPLIKKLLEIRNYFYSIGYIKSRELAENLILSTQKILLIYQQTVSSKVPISNLQVSEYESLMEKIMGKYSKELSIRSFDVNIKDVLMVHSFILKELGNQAMVKTIDEFMIREELLPVYREKSNINEILREVFKFKVSQDGKYSLLADSSLKNVDLKINNESITPGQYLEIKEGDYEISRILDTDPKNDIALGLNNANEAFSSGEIIGLKKDSPVSFKGRIRLDKPSFVFFAQNYNLGWVLTLFKENKQTEVKDHFMGNLYNNAWWINETGEFDFKIEFKPQNNVTTGIILSLLSWIGILAIFCYLQIRKKT